MTDRRVLNYTTTIEVRQSVGECTELLTEAGADAVAVLNRDRLPVGLSFRLTTSSGPRDFTMPVNIAGVAKLLADMPHTAGMVKSGAAKRARTPEQAARVAWRITKDWLEAQLAIIDAQMVTLEQVMLPYLQVAPGRTLYELYVERGGLAIEAAPHG